MTQEFNSPILPVVGPQVAVAPLPALESTHRTGPAFSPNVAWKPSGSVADVYLSLPTKPHQRPRIVPLPEVAPTPIKAPEWEATVLPEPVPAPVLNVEPVPAPPVVVPEPIQRPDVPVAIPSLGVLDALLANDDVHDILVNGTESIYIDAGGELADSGLRFASQDDLWRVVETIIQAMGQRWDASRPMVDTRLPDGSRVNIVAPPMAVDGVNISIRKFPKIRLTFESMVASGQITQPIADFLRILVTARLNIVVAGGTGVGKTTLLNVLSSAIHPKERIVTIEDSAELRLQQPHVVRLEAKSPSESAQTPILIRDLVKNALRMRPDRIIVGESRGEEAFDVLQAMNTGHEGSMTSLHANNPRDALGRLETMITMAMPQMPLRMVRTQIANTLNILIQITRSRDGQRRISHISEVGGIEGDTIIVQDLVVYRDADKGQPAEYRWVAGSSRNVLITQAAQQAGLMREFR